AEQLRALRAPAATLLAYARRAHAAIDPADPHREYLEVVRREAERLEAMLDGVRAPQPVRIHALDRVQPNDLVHLALKDLTERLVRRRIRLVKKLATDVPVLLVDATRVRDALGALLHNAVEAVPLGGRIRVETRQVASHVVIEIAH